MFSFENTTRLSLLNALRLAQASELIYESSWKSVETKVRSDWGFTGFAKFDVSGTESFVCADTDRIIGVFRGTQTRDDWLTDLNVQLIPSAVGRVHRGFSQALDFVWKEMRESILEFRTEKQSLWIAGHSLGGALATLAVDRLTEEDMEVSGLYTYGQPRAGDQDFAENFDDKIKSRSFRCVNDEDIVPRVPPRILGYEHIGVIRFLDFKGALHYDNIFWNQLLSYSESGTARAMDRYEELKAQYPNSLEDHSIARYISRIERNEIKERGVSSFRDYLRAM